jgi:hypothetical protein
MTEAELRTLFPKASDAFIRANATASRSLVIPAPPPPSPSPAQTPPATAKGRRGRTVPAKNKKPKKSRVPLVRNGGTWSEAKYWGSLRSGIRRLFRFWKPAVDALRAARVPFRGPHNQRYAYLCAGCGKLFKRREVHVDHRVPCGKLTSLEHLPEFVRRLTAEGPEAFQVLCIATCHRKKTDEEAKKSC